MKRLPAHFRLVHDGRLPLGRIGVLDRGKIQAVTMSGRSVGFFPTPVAAIVALKKAQALTIARRA